MKISLAFKKMTPFLLGLTMIGASAHAQNDQSWVSAEGTDINPCNRDLPCKSFAGALSLSKTNAGGEIVVLDPGVMAVLLISQLPIPLPLMAGNTFAGITTSGRNGIVIQAGQDDVVILHNLSIMDALSPNNDHCILFISGKVLIVENCKISRYGNSITMAGGGHLVVKMQSSKTLAMALSSHQLLMLRQYPYTI